MRAPLVLRLWARIEYDGTDFFGFQVQSQERTVQGELERALKAVTGRPTRVIGAGRTDRGVHAKGQVIGFETEWQHSLTDLHRALNAVLARDLSIRQLGFAAQGFHPRFSAVRRVYRYTISNRPWPSPLERRTAWHLAHRLDMVAMTQASLCLVGTHDFGAFGRPPQGDNAVRTVMRAVWRAKGSRLTFEIEANAFLYRMVRTIVGALVQVGLGEVSHIEFEAILQAQERSRIKRVAPAHGLCLVRVDYAVGEGVFQ